MASRPEDMLEFVRSLSGHPEALAELRRMVVSAELAQLSAEVHTLAEAQRRTEERLEALTARVDTIAEAMQELARRMDELARQVEALAAHLSTLTGQIGNMRGELLEMRYYRLGHTYFAPIARRLQRMDVEELDRLLDAALAAGTLTEEDADEIRLADLMFRGRRRTDGVEVVLVVETSGVVDATDVHRAAARAARLAHAGHETIAVVAGQAVSDEAVDVAVRDGVWRVTDGRVEPPERPTLRSV